MYALGDGESPRGNEFRTQPGAAVINLPQQSFEHAGGSQSLLNFRHPSNVVPAFSRVQSSAVGVVRLVVGLLCIVFNVVNICFIDQVGWVVYITGNGFWTGCMCLASGGLGIAASRNKSRLLIAGCVLADVTTSFIALQQVIIGVRGAVWATHLCTYQRLLNKDDACYVGHVTTAMESCLAAIAVLAIVASVWSLVISCRALSCCARVSDSQFGTSSSSYRDAWTSSASVVYRQGSDDVITSTSSHGDRSNRYAALY